jgi:NAD(P)-dependent dehydrogenase (short-subunit alcohol dehydrogenase family)
MEDRKVAIVTGAASGIGAAIAERFAESGIAVALFDINGDGARAMAKKLGAKAKTVAIEGDVSNEEHVRSAVEETIGELGTPDILINNAGIEVNGSVTDLSSSQWDHQIAVNLRSVFLMSKYTIPKMVRGGAIVNISSVHALVSWPGCAAYDASKAAMIGLTRAMALDHGHQQIRVNAICPGYIETPLWDQWLAELSDPAATMREVLEAHPLGRTGKPKDVAEAALFLVSEGASFISGTHLVVDGAMTAGGH